MLELHQLQKSHYFLQQVSFHPLKERREKLKKKKKTSAFSDKQFFNIHKMNSTPKEK
jgi:hypothetical protein